MASSDPISDTTPNKRRKLDNGGWDSEDDSGDDFTVDDFDTVATIPVQNRGALQYTTQQFHRDLNTGQEPSSLSTHITQPTQTFNATTQPTQPARLQSPNTSDVLVDRSSPTTAVSPRAPPQPIRKAFARPNSLLASAMAPPGTSFRRPLGIPSRPATIDLVDSDEDPPVHHSSDEETQGLRSNLKPTNFQKSGRDLDSTPKRSEPVIKESPKPAAAPVAPNVNNFSNMLAQFSHNSSTSASSRPADDLISAYGSSSRRPRPQGSTARPPPARAPTAQKKYNHIDDIPDYTMRRKVMEIKKQLDWESVQRCVEALDKRHGNVQDAMEWLTNDEEQDAPGDDDQDHLAPIVPAKRGVATVVGQSAMSQGQSSSPIRPAAKQEIKAPTLTIAEKYKSTQPGRKQSQPNPVSPTVPEEDDVKPRRRLLQGRKAPRVPTPPSSPPAPSVRTNNAQQNEVIEIDSDSDSGIGRYQNEEPETSTFDTRLLKFFNECSTKDLVDLSAQPEDVVKLVVEKRPFDSLDAVRAVTAVTETKTGKKSRSRPVGDKIVELCSQMWTGYDAVDELVEECERLAKPIQDALKGWGVGSGVTGELQMMNLDEAHDSGIGTPASSCADDVPAPSKTKGRFVAQPESMSSEVTLKDYQLVGLNWLSLLWSKKISCILADDMGLGKTCQVIAFLAHLQQQEVEGMHLVIVPGSTLENWLREFKRFAPNLNVVPYYGAQAERPELQYQIQTNADSIDVVVTTYDMAVKPDDNKFLRKLRPAVCVYDEAHALRNPRSDRYAQLTRIPATFKVLLTGTPLQNNLRELVAILAFIMPDLFADKNEDLQYVFQHKASTKDADHAALLSAQRIARARTMMTPFILRRKKHQVLDLPAKHSRVEYCDMTASQANYYADLMDEAQQVLVEKTTKKKGTTKLGSQMLMALRQAAIHPLLARRLYDDKKIDKIVTELLKHDEYRDNNREMTRAYLAGEHHQSFKGGDFGLHRFCAERHYLKKFALKKQQWLDAAKIAKFEELVTAYAKNGDRVLVFSQFTTMMNILEAVLETLAIKFHRLDGSTDMQKRQTMIDEFTNDESIPVFMLSTKAGGAGINLACANKVIIFDSGFNPQDDIQAENRAHRVGQTRDVEVVRLVTRHTIEEQIHALGESKLALDDRVAGEGATEADGKKAEKAGEEIVEHMLMEQIREKGKEGEGEPQQDLKDAFKSGLEGVGVKVASKQAQF